MNLGRFIMRELLFQYTKKCRLNLKLNPTFHIDPSKLLYLTSISVTEENSPKLLTKHFLS